jgi:hypothetical protein
MAQYDPVIIAEYAARLYRRAALIVFRYGMYGLFPGMCAGFGLARFADASFQLGNGGLLVGLGILGFGSLGLAIGVIIGQERAFLLKLQAQLALCQARIELNTRKYA